MGQTFTDNCYQSDHVGQTDLANMETNFATLKSNFSGTSAPGSPVAGQNWFDTTNKLPRFRNQGDTAWLAYLTGSSSQKLWLYKNSAEDGWAIDSGVTDVVLGLKGGSTYTAGAATAGSWTLSGIDNTSLVLQVYDKRANGQDDYVYNSSGVARSLTNRVTKSSGDARITVSATAGQSYDDDMYTKSASHAHTHDGTDRLAAAVGTLQYPDI